MSAPQPVDDTQEEKDEQGKLQEDGKDQNTKILSFKAKLESFWMDFTFTRKIFSSLHLWLISNYLHTESPKELTEEEKLQILHSGEFLSFFERGSTIVERALAEQVDVCFDYSGRDLEDKEG